MAFFSRFATHKPTEQAHCACCGSSDRLHQFVVDQLTPTLADFRYLHSTRADLLRRLGRTAEARAAYLRAKSLTPDGPELRFLERRLTELAPAPHPT